MPWQHDHRRRRPVLAFLVGVAIVGTLLLAFDELIDARRTGRVLHKDSSALSQQPTSDECIGLMIDARIQKSKRRSSPTSTKVDWGIATPAQKYKWKALDCVHVLSLYEQRELGHGDVLPEDVHKSTVSLENQRLQMEMTKAAMAHLTEREIRFSPAFGTLLSILRNGVAVLPWDDDIDLLVDNRDVDFREKLTRGLTRVSFDQVLGPKYGLADAWEVPGGWIVYYKIHGTPWKMHKKGQGYPRLDLYPFGKMPGSPEISWISPSTLRNGHLQRFEKPDAWFGSMNATVAVPYSADLPDLVEFPLPDEARRVAVDDYGEEGLTYCQVSFNHDTFCTQGSSTTCRETMANRLARLKFPCVLLPASLHGGTLANEEGYAGEVVSS